MQLRAPLLAFCVLLLSTERALDYQEIHLWGGVFCHREEPARNIAERLVSDPESRKRSVERARIAFALHRSREKVRVSVMRGYHSWYHRAPACTCDTKSLVLNDTHAQARPLRVGQIIKVRSYEQDHYNPELQHELAYWYVLGSLEVCGISLIGELQPR